MVEQETKVKGRARLPPTGTGRFLEKGTGASDPALRGTCRHRDPSAEEFPKNQRTQIFIFFWINYETFLQGVGGERLHIADRTPCSCR